MVLDLVSQKTSKDSFCFCKKVFSQRRRTLPTTTSSSLRHSLLQLPPPSFTSLETFASNEASTSSPLFLLPLHLSLSVRACARVSAQARICVSQGDLKDALVSFAFILGLFPPTIGLFRVSHHHKGTCRKAASC